MSLAPWQTGANPAAFGTRPAPVQPQNTAPAAVSTAENQGNNVYNQLPGYGTDLDNVGSNITAETAGQLPADVIQQITNQAAARGVSNGTGAAATNQDLLKTLGLTSLNLTQMGQQGLNTQLGMLPGAQLYQNPAFYPTTGQTYEAGVQNSLDAAAPDPFAAGNAAIGAAGGGFNAGFGGGGGGLPPTPGGTSPSTAGGSPGGTLAGGPGWIPGVPIGAPSNMDTLSALLQSYNPNGNASGGSAGGEPYNTNVGPGQSYFGNNPAATQTALSPDAALNLYGAEGNGE